MDVYENSVYPQCGHFIGKIVINNGISSFSSPNSVATLRVLTVRVKAVFNRGVLIRVRHFSCKFPYKIALLKCQCAFRLRRLAQNAVPGAVPGHFSCKFPQNCPSQMLMCVSSAQARTKCAFRSSDWCSCSASSSSPSP